MRTARAFIMAILIPLFGPGFGPTLAQARTDDTPALETIRMLDKQTGWAVTDRAQVGALLRTTDGGTHWRDVTPLSAAGQKIGVFQITAVSSLIAWVLPAGTIGQTTTQILHTVDGGRTWRSATISAPSVDGIHFITPRDGWLVASLVATMGNDEVEIYRSTDGGETWIKVASATRESESSGLSVVGDKSGITFLDATTGWITGGIVGRDWLFLYVTHDGGRTWRHQNLPLPPQVASPWGAHTRPPTLFTAQDGILPAYYTFLAIPIRYWVVFYVTRDGGTTWTHTAPVTLTYGYVSSSFADVDHGWVAEGDVLHITSDGGRHWATIRPGPPFADVRHLDFISPRVGWAVQRTSPFLLKTLDGGCTWAPVTYTISQQ